MTDLVPPYVTPGLCPFGIVVKVFTDTGALLAEQHIEVGTGDTILDMLTTYAVDAVDRAVDADPTIERITVAGYDGDSGELMISTIFNQTDE